MELQFELFPDYPRLVPAPIVHRPDIMDEAWKLFDYPESDGEPMAEDPEHANELVNIKNALSAILAEKPHTFSAIDTNFYIIMTVYDKEGKPAKKQRKLAPDLIVALGVADIERSSFNLRLEQQALMDKFKLENPTLPPLRPEDVHFTILTFEVMSRSNYRDKPDQWRRWWFYQCAGVQEYIVIHTREEKKRRKKQLSLEMYYRNEGVLARMLDFPEHTSLVAGIKLRVENNKLLISDLDGNVFLSYDQEIKNRKKAEAKAQTAEIEAEMAKEKAQEAEAKAQEAEAEAQKAKAETKMAKEKAQEAEAKAKKAEAEAEEERLAYQEMQSELEEMKRLLEIKVNENLN